MNDMITSNISEEDKLKAAYALNLCTVSVSQIIDYNDLNVLEQEYEAILNNLNLEQIPKDEALLHILKQLLDTITYFRIQEGDRKLIDKEYQQKMKNAIWSAVPNLGLIVAGGNPVTMAISLASQVGIGYMNYRKAKCENESEYERQLWQLQRSAMEQFNGLRRELFDTAWRLAGTYNFPDEYRLTERQIKQYDDILMDMNVLRRYDRLDSIKDSFIAYPPFWYQFGNTANEISRDETLELSDDTRGFYRDKAKSFFEQYWKVNNNALLREDLTSSACALEYVDLLLEDKADVDVIDSYLEKAVKFSGKACDVMQMCAITYLRVGQSNLAAPILRYLVNEDYNISINAQILSGIYVHQGISGDTTAKALYETLTGRVPNRAYLIPWPTDNARLWDDFITAQRELLTQKYRNMLDTLKEMYVIKLNRILPTPKPFDEYPDSFFTETQRDNRIDQMRNVFAMRDKKEEYLSVLSQNTFSFTYIDIFNQLFESIGSLESIGDFPSLLDAASEKVESISPRLNELQSRIQKREFTMDDYVEIQDYTSEGFISFIFSKAADQIAGSIETMSDMADFSREESRLAEFCKNNDLPDPDYLLMGGGNRNQLTTTTRTFFNYSILGEDAEIKAKKRDKYNRMRDVIMKNIKDCLVSKNNIRVIMSDDKEFQTYFDKKDRATKQHRPDTIGILDDTGRFSNIDLMFTTVGIAIIVRDSLERHVTYESVEKIEDGDGLRIGVRTYKNKNVDINKLYEAIKELNSIVVER